MALTRITGNEIQQGSITNDLLAPGVAAGPLIANVQIANSSYGLIDDTTVSLDGGYIVITGSNFTNNTQVSIGNTLATSVTFISSNTIRAQVPAKSAGSYLVILVDQDSGSTAIRVNGLTYSGTPTWVTDTTLPEGLVDEVISIQLSATSDSNVSYSLVSGSSLPSGLSLAANGLLSGTVTGLENDTTYNFTIEATDEENQESPRSFSVTITVADEYFKETVLLLNGDGTNGAQNNTFLDSSSNNFTITRNGNTTQGTFSPFSLAAGEWSNYFDGSGDYLSLPSTSALSENGDFTHEAWCYFVGSGSSDFDIIFQKNITGFLYIARNKTGGNAGKLVINSHNIGNVAFGSTVLQLNRWYHIAFVRSGSGSNNCKVYLDGQLEIQTTNTTNYTGTAAAYVGSYFTTHFSNWYLSNVRISNSARYASTFTPPTQPFTSDANTELLTCQSNRFVDNSTNAFAITRNGDVRVTPFSPFAPTAAYSAGTNGGSGYFDGTGDYLTVPDNAAFDFNGAFTIECWLYLTANNDAALIDARSTISPTNGYLISPRANGTTQVNLTTSTILTGAIVRPLNSWSHLVVVRDASNNISLFINGQRDVTTTNSGTFNCATNLHIGAKSVSGSGLLPITGYVAGMKIIKGTAVYDPTQTTLSIPTSPPVDSSGTSLLLNFTNAGIIDNTGKNVLETVGNAQIDTTVKKFGTGSMKFDGTGDYLLIPDSNDLHFGSGDFTAECWVYPTASPNQPVIMGQWSGSISSTTLSWVILLSNDANRNLRFALSTNGSGVLTDSISSSALTLNAWSHVALVRNGNVFTAYLNGTSAVTYTITAGTALYNATNQISIGGSSTGVQPFQGYIDDLRITKGVARYTSNFSVPTRAHKLK